MLVPFCFFGGALVASGNTMDMTGNSALQMGGCALSLATNCTPGMDDSAMGMIAHHVGMYLSITQTPLVFALFAMIIAAVFFLTAFVLIREWLSLLFAWSSLLRLTQRASEPRRLLRQSLLTWLSLFETSPTFA